MKVVVSVMCMGVCVCACVGVCILGELWRGTM